MHDPHATPADAVAHEGAPDEHDLPVGVDRSVVRTPRWQVPRPTWLSATAAALALGLLGVGFWAFSLNGNLDDSRRELAATQSDLAEARNTIEDVGAELERERSRASELELLSQRQEDCMEALETRAALLKTIADKQREIRNLTARDSAWAEATVGFLFGLQEALSASRDSGVAAAEGQWAEAVDWAQVSLSHQEEAVAQSEIATAEMDKINAMAAEVNAMWAQLPPPPVDCSAFDGGTAASG